MSITISSSTEAAVFQMFEALRLILKKAAEHAEANKIDEAVILDWRLSADMFPFVTQVRFATEIPARALSRLAGAELPGFKDEEKSFAELLARIDRAEAIIKGLDKSALDANPDGDVTVPMGPMEMTLPRVAFAQTWILPNLYFHVMTAYMILRNIGVDIGKRDYLVSLAKYLPEA